MEDFWEIVLMVLVIIGIGLAILISVVLFGSIGILFGSGVALYNYGISFSKNVQFEKQKK